ncbi:MAG: sulfatase/phosphatase domain-containing protein, partial [Planctomycetota bacterium]
RGNFPMWVRNQRNSRHGVDFGYNLHGFSPAVYYRRYCESLLAVDDGVGKLRKALNDRNLADNTLIVYMGDNGLQFGDHGLIDKRVAYEASARVPLILAGPGIPAGCRDSDLIGNIDIAPTLLDAAGVTADAWSEKLPGDRQIQFDGVSAWGSIGNASGNGPRSELLYEYYWERNYPHTPTLHAVIGGRYKFIRCHGLWDREEFYDLQQDPGEMQNLMTEPEHAARIAEHRTALWKMLSETGGDAIPLLADEGPVFPARDAAASGPAAFPDEFLVPSQPK